MDLVLHSVVGGRHLLCPVILTALPVWCSGSEIFLASLFTHDGYLLRYDAVIDPAGKTMSLTAAASYSA
jgi:hypothetical protein